MNDTYCDSLDRKLESFERALENNNGLMREMISEMKRSNDAVITHIDYMKKDAKRVEESVDELADRVKYLESEMLRVGFLEENMRQLSAAPASSPNASNIDAWFNTKLSKIVLWGSAIIGGILLHKWTEIILTR